MKKVLIVVDMQKDFVTGSLGNLEAVAILDNVRKKIDQYQTSGDMIIFTYDTHGSDYLKTFEGKLLPIPHCIMHTDGWNLAIDIATPNAKQVIKDTFGVINWETIIGSEPDQIELCGLCTDICVISNALILRTIYPNIPIMVDALCCAGVTPQLHSAALSVMQSCQIQILHGGRELIW